MLENEPTLFEDLRPVWDAFWRLCSDRPVGMAVGAIPFMAIDRYAERYGIEDFEEFDRLIQVMDTEYLSHVRNK